MTTNALHIGWYTLSQTAGFFSTAGDGCPIMGPELVCKALAIADNKASFVLPGPIPFFKEGKIAINICIQFISNFPPITDHITTKLILIYI